jgi:hypothetical protein
MTSTSAQAAGLTDGEGRYLSFEVKRGPGEYRSLTVRRGDGEVLLHLERGADLRYLAELLNE